MRMGYFKEDVVPICFICTVLARDGNGAGIPRPRRGPASERGKFPAPVGERGGDGEKNPPRSGGGGGGGGKSLPGGENSPPRF